MLARVLRLLTLLPVVVLAACAAPAISTPLTPPAPPAMRWDGHAGSAKWTSATLSALHSDGAPLLSETPRDIGEWCPGYLTGNASERAAFWAGLFSALAKHESTWNPRAAGGGGAWIGLVQIAPQTARAYGCDATTSEALKDGAANLRCAVRIAAVTVPRDDMVATGRQGLAADWGPFLSEAKRADMVGWTRQQSYCQL
jgi:hypothetical protein